MLRSLILLGLFAVATAQQPVDAGYFRAWQLLGQGHSREAISILQGMLDSGRGSVAAVLLLCHAYVYSDTVTAGDEYFRKLIALAPSSALGHLGLSRNSASVARRTEARDHAAACVHMDPSILVCRTLLVDALYETSNADDLFAQVSRIVPFDPDKAESQYALCYLRLHCDEPHGLVGIAQEAARLAQQRGDLRLMAETERQLAEAHLVNGAGGRRLAADHSGAACRYARRLADPVAEFEYCERAAGYALQAGLPGEQMYIDLISAAHRMANPAVEAQLESGFALSLEPLGRLDEALEHYDRAITLLSALPETRAIQNFFMYRGKLHMRMGSSEAAIGDLERGLTAGTAATNTAPRAHVLAALTVAYNQTGNALDAIRTAQEAVRLFRQNGMDRQAGAELSDIGWAYLTLGDFPTAIRYFQDSLAGAKRFQDPGEIVRNSNLLATAYLEIRQPDVARTVLLEALEPLDRVRDPQFAVRTYTLLGEAESQLHQFDEARTQLQLALQLVKTAKHAWLEAEAWSALGRHFLRTGALAEAERSFQSCLALAEPAELKKSMQEARKGLAEIAQRRNRPKQALEWLEKSVDAIESLRSTAPGPELRTGLMQRNWAVYSDLVQTAGTLHQLDPSAGYEKLALTYNERGRARVLLDLLEESRAGLKVGLTPAQAERQRVLEKKLSVATTRLRTANDAAARAAVDAAELALKRWSTELRVENPRYHNLKYPAPLDAEGIRKLAAERRITIVEYALGSRSSRVWVAADGALYSAALPGEAAISAAVRRLRTSLSRHPAGAAAEAYRQPARSLYAMLIGPVARHIRHGSGTVIVADGILHYLPFEALLAPNGHFLIEQTSISYAPSASVLAELERRRPPSSPRALLALGNPDFGEPAAPAAVARDVYRAAGLNFRPLPGTELEVRSIAALFAGQSTRMLLGRDATESAFKHEPLDQYRRLHLATHALIDERAPARSGLVLSLVRTDNEDGVLQISEIMGLRLDAGLVTLSACQTGLGHLVHGEGMVGFTSAFLFAGARRLAVSLWPVSDSVTPELMRGFYGGLRAGEAPSLSLQAVKLQMLKSAVPAYRNPHYWAGFVLLGAR